MLPGNIIIMNKESIAKIFETTDPVLIDYIDHFMSRLHDYEFIKPRLFVKALPTEIAEDCNLINSNRGDICLVPAILVFSDNERLIAFNITHNLLTLFDVSESELMDTAMKNTEKLAKPVFQKIGKMFDDSDSEFYFVGDENEIAGSSVFFLPEFFHEICEKMKSDFYVIPYSETEMFIVPVEGISCERLKDFLRFVNQFYGTRFLSNSVYICNINDQAFAKM